MRSTLFKIKFVLFLLSMILTQGCVTDQYRLPHNHWPIKYIKEAPLLPMHPYAAMTLGSNVYVQDLDAWKNLIKNDQLVYSSSMIHEKIHAIRQKRMGLYIWLVNYILDPRFRKIEEQIPRYHELLYREMKNSLHDVWYSVSGLYEDYFGCCSLIESYLWHYSCINSIQRGSNEFLRSIQ